MALNTNDAATENPGDGGSGQSGQAPAQQSQAAAEPNILYGSQASIQPEDEEFGEGLEDDAGSADDDDDDDAGDPGDETDDDSESGSVIDSGDGLSGRVTSRFNKDGTPATGDNAGDGGESPAAGTAGGTSGQPPAESQIRVLLRSQGWNVDGHTDEELSAFVQSQYRQQQEAAARAAAQEPAPAAKKSDDSAGAAAATGKKWQAPEYDPEWVNQVVVGEKGGYAPADTTNPEHLKAAIGLNKFAKFLRDTNRQLAENPLDVLDRAGLWEEVERRAEAKLQALLSQQQQVQSQQTEQQQIQSLQERLTSHLYEREPTGEIKVARDAQGRVLNDIYTGRPSLVLNDVGQQAQQLWGTFCEVHGFHPQQVPQEYILKAYQFVDGQLAKSQAVAKSAAGAGAAVPAPALKTGPGAAIPAGKKKVGANTRRTANGQAASAVPAQAPRFLDGRIPPRARNNEQPGIQKGVSVEDLRGPSNRRVMTPDEAFKMAAAQVGQLTE